MSEVPRLFDTPLAARRLARARRAGAADFLIARVAADLDERLQTVLRRFDDVLDFFTPGPEAAAVMAARNPQAHIRRFVLPGLAATGTGETAADPETLDPGIGTCDCAVSLLALHAMDDLPGALARLRRALRPDGLFIAALTGGETLHELRHALMVAEEETTGGVSPRVYPFADIRACGALLQRAGFALPVADSETITVRYPDPLALLRDLRAMGATNALASRSRRPLRRQTLMRALDIYTGHHADRDGRVRATFEILWMSGWAPHDSQQKPLAPGSARTSLREVLGRDPAPPKETTP